MWMHKNACSFFLQSDFPVYYIDMIYVIHDNKATFIVILFVIPTRGQQCR